MNIVSMNRPQVREAYRVESLAKRWECSPNHIYDMIRKGRLQHFKIGKLIRVAAAEVARIEAGECGSSSTGESGASSPEKVERHDEEALEHRIARLRNGL